VHQSLFAREQLRRKYRPARVKLLFVGESPPTSARFFYQADSGLYRAFRDTFVSALPNLDGADFLESFSNLGCYLVDLCEAPVDKLTPRQRKAACLRGESRLSDLLVELRPKIIVTVVLSIVENVRRAQTAANWDGTHLALRYPGRWRHHQRSFKTALLPLLQSELQQN
jgi:hypothetical protein